MKRVGGGLRRLNANVDYAYLDDEVFSLLRDCDARPAVQKAVVEMLEEDMKEKKTENKRLALAFSEGFALSIPAVVQVLKVAAENDEGGGLDRHYQASLSQETTLGPNYVKAMPRYCVGTGLLDQDYGLTPFGNAVGYRDPHLSSHASLWMMHYYLAAPNGPGPKFWHHLVTTLLRPDDVLQSKDVGETIRCHASQDGRKITVRTSRNAATAILGTYSKMDSLGPLATLEKEGPGQYRVLTPSAPPVWAFAYALADYWAANWGDVTGVNLTRVSEEGGIGPVFMMGSGLVNKYLGELQREGFAVVQRRTPPFQLTRNWASPEVFLERMYG